MVAATFIVEGKVLFLGFDSFFSYWGGLYGWPSGFVAGGLAGGIGAWRGRFLVGVLVGATVGIVAGTILGIDVGQGAKFHSATVLAVSGGIGGAAGGIVVSLINRIQGNRQ